MLCQGTYWYYKFNGINVPIIISTQGSTVPVAVEIYIDEIPVFKNESLLRIYTFKDVKFPIGIHRLQVIIDKEILYDGSFLVLPVRWIYMEWNKHADEENGDINFFVEFYSAPVGLM
jgi:hypothetical protein